MFLLLDFLPSILIFEAKGYWDIFRQPLDRPCGRSTPWRLL
jgi:hypothetical protein